MYSISGSDHIFLAYSALPNGANSQTIQPIRVKKRLMVMIYKSASPTHFYQIFNMYVFEKDTTYDTILGLDVLVPLGIDISCSTKSIQWNNMRVHWKPLPYFDNSLLQDPITMESHCMYLRSTNDDYYEGSFLPLPI